MAAREDGGVRERGRAKALLLAVSGILAFLAVAPDASGEPAAPEARTVLVPNSPPVAVATPGAASVAVGDRLTLSASSSYDPDGRIVSSRWTLGDRSVSRSEIVVRFPTPGLLVAVLTVTDDRGRESVARVPIEVLPVIPGPILILSAGSNNLVEMPARGTAEVVLELVAYDRRACGLRLEVLDDGGFTVSSRPLPDCVEPGQSATVTIELRAPESAPRSRGATVLVRVVSDSGVTSEVERLDVMVREDLLGPRAFAEIGGIAATFGACAVAYWAIRRRVRS